MQFSDVHLPRFPIQVSSNGKRYEMRVDEGQTVHLYVCGAVRILSLPINAKSSYN